MAWLEWMVEMAGQTGDADVLALVILLARVNQSISSVMIQLVEHQAKPQSADDVLRALGAEMAWVSEVIRGSVQPGGESPASLPG